uniref:Secreted peptide prohormone-2 n=1 Tax=Schmidtea mediterranea TaxID=79327 RepID=E3CTK7_SCHMD|nr:TPA_inf: secreted peptide prohormone-2 [Schmidtea mediterranea]
MAIKILYSFLSILFCISVQGEFYQNFPADSNPCDELCEPQNLCDKLCSSYQNSDFEHEDAKRAVFLRLGRNIKRAPFLRLGRSQQKKSKFLRLGK